MRGKAYYTGFYGLTLIGLSGIGLQAVSLFSWSVEQNAQDTQMSTRVTAALVSRVSRRSRVRGLPSLNLKKKRNRSQSIQKWDPEGVYFLQRLPCSVFKQIKIHVTQRHFYRVYSSKKAVWVSILSHSSFVYHKILRWEKDY